MKTYRDSEELSRSDTEITLGTRSILGIFFGLALICGVFFGFGYSLGRGNANKARVSGQSGLQVLGSEPSSSVKTVVEGATPSSADASDDSSNLDTTEAGAPPKNRAAVLQSKPSASAAAIPAVEQTLSVPVQSALTASSNNVKAASAVPAAPSAAPTASPVSSELLQGVPIMVQVAAVSHREDADALISSLKKLGYDASVRNESTDSLLHVQVGPFASRDEAKAMRTKLLNDGYNAIVK